ncbi:MAG: isoleucine--tRNA ligase [Kiritimatiellae bacterium]|nr:isoleucine--tRNA ligase [Kiritimatiellia bacterium]MDW8458588.1 isoleucine--tRNA ligase [Verrucomicrobiota bacterium]
MFRPVSNKVHFPSLEEEILRFWETGRIFERSLEQRRGAKEYVFYDGPPFATGLPHYGHLLAGTIKDIVPRYHTMRGFYVERRFGWDCHGLPIEALAQEHLGLAGTAAIRERGVDVFNETCRSLVLRYVSEWRKTVTRMGRWVDFDNDYKTMDLSYMESIWWVFKQLWDKGRVYRSYRIMPYSWKLTTPLSNFEAGNNYQDVQDPSITVRLRIPGEELARRGFHGEWYFLIWTTTPWTLPANLAVCVGPDLDYVAVRDKKEGVVYILAEARLGAYYKTPSDYEVVARFKGADLKGWRYTPLFPYLEGQPRAFVVLADSFVSTEDGTGIVHIAPAYGEDDFRVGRDAGIPPIDLLDENAAFTARVPEYAGQFCKDADKAIIRRLKEEGKLVHHSTIVHSYPFCERTDTPLIYRAIEAWYVRVEDLREQLVANNATVHWMPEAIGEKRFGNWLREAKDWNISRNRFWGSCIPVWINVEDKDDMICVGSIAELEALSGQRVTDLHKHIVDRIEIIRNGKRYRRTPEVLDCWFESGAMPYAQMHYPFENKERFEKNFPADFIAEGLDQTRGWFYTLMVLSTALFGRAAYKNVVVNGLVLAEDGRKMSKRLKNYPDPQYILDTYGADALRLYMINSPIVRADDLRFSEEGVKQSLRHLLIPWWNAFSFFVTYARLDGWTPRDAIAGSSINLLDRWILSSLERLNADVVEAMDRYDLQRAVRPFVDFIEALTNWYIRRSRRRFWKSDNDADKQAAYTTLYEVLMRLSRIAAPFVPFISEAIYCHLRTPELPESVHLCDYPLPEPSRRDLALEEQMADVLRVVELARSIRTQHDLKIRQPLRRMRVVCHDPAKLARVEALADVLADELNVREVLFSAHESDLADLSAKPDFKKLGPKLGSRMRKVAEAIRSLSAEQVEQLLEDVPLILTVEGEPFELTKSDILVERKPRPNLAVAADAEFAVALDTALDEDLIREGLAREFVNKVQNLRKALDFDIADRIRVRVSGDPAVRESIVAHQAYIVSEILALSLEWAEGSIDEGEAVELNGRACKIFIEKT